MILRPLALALLLASPAAAQSPGWYLTPNVSGPEDCGGECDEIATAWVSTEDGRFAFGVSCFGTMMLAGPGTLVDPLPFDRTGIAVDGTTFGSYQVQAGMNDVYISPEGGGEPDWSRLRPALTTGEALELRAGSGETLAFTLYRAREAMEALARLCAD